MSGVVRRWSRSWMATRAPRGTTVAKRRPVIQGSGGGQKRPSGSDDYVARRENTDGVVVAYPHRPDAVNARFHVSLINLLAYDTLGAQTPEGKKIGGKHRLFGNGGHLPLSSGANIVSARNKLVKRFLDEHTAPWLWFCDDDMTFDPDTLDRLIESTKWSAEEEKLYVETVGEPSP